MNKLITIIVLFISWQSTISGQQIINLDDVLRMARGDSYLSSNAKTIAEISKQEYKLFQSSLKPALSLDGQIPGYFQTTSGITQPNGSIEFQRIAQNNSKLSLFAIQEISATGGQVFVQSDLRRFDDFTNENSLYNGVPFRVGLIQPIFGFNSMKWNKKIAPLALKESLRKYNADMENTQLQAVFYYNQILIASENLKIATLNSEVNERLLNIAIERLNLGKISEDEKLQLEIELDNAKLSQSLSEHRLGAAENNLWTFLGKKISSDDKEYSLPEPMIHIVISEEKAVEMGLDNRPEIIAFERRLQESNKAVAQAKAKTGPQANLFASYGYSRGSAALSDIYSAPFAEQQVSLTFSLPILDWGKRKSTVKLAELSREDEIAKSLQQKAELVNSINLKVREFLMLQNAIQDQKSIRGLAEKRFTIANERYILGAISITDWTLAQREKDSTRRNYIQTLSNYWQSYYEVRFLTGYDFLLNKKIIY